MKTNIFRMPNSLSVALVSGMLATGACSGDGTSAVDGAASDVKVEMVADATTPAEASAERPADVAAELAMDTPGPTQPDGGAMDVRDGSSPQDLPREFPTV